MSHGGQRGRTLLVLLFHNLHHNRLSSYSVTLQTREVDLNILHMQEKTSKVLVSSTKELFDNHGYM